MRVAAALLLCTAVAFPATSAAQPPASVEVCEGSTRDGTLRCWWEVPGAATPGQGGGDDDGPAAPAPVTCTYVTAADKTGYVETDPTAGTQVRITADGRVEVLYFKQCSDGTWAWRWIADQPPPGAALPTPEELLPGVRGELEKMLPQPTWHTPADTNPNGWAYVNTPTYFWLDDGVWAERSAEGGFGPVWVRAWAEPAKVLVDPGDGSPVVECPFDPPAYVPGTPTADFAGCGYRYLNSSAVAPNGASFPVSVSLVWHAAWEGSGGAGGDLGELVTSAEPRDLPVAEVQAIVTAGA